MRDIDGRHIADDDFGYICRNAYDGNYASAYIAWGISSGVRYAC